MATRIVKDELPALFRAVTDLTRHHVLIGIPGDAAARTLTGVGLSNADIGYIMEYGAPSANIPARPFLVPGVSESIPRVLELMRQGAVKALTLKADPDVGMRTLHSVGLVASSSVKRYILRGIPPPLAAATIARRRNRKVAPRTGTLPLVDTGQLYRSVTYVLRRV